MVEIFPEDWKSRVVRVLEEPPVSSTDFDGNSSKVVKNFSEEWQPRVVRVLEEPPVSSTDYNESSSSGSNRGRTRYHQIVQPWGSKEWYRGDRSLESHSTATAGTSLESTQVAEKEEAELDLGGPEFTELDTQPLSVLPDQSSFLSERYLQNAEAEQRCREKRLKGVRGRFRERKNGAASERRNLICSQP